MFALIKKVFSKPFSNDEKIIFGLLKERIPSELRERFSAQVDAIKKSAPSPDQKSIVYEINANEIPSILPRNGKLVDLPGEFDFAEIHIRMFEQIQPFVLVVKEGFIHSLRLLEPIKDDSDLPEFSVTKFTLNH